MRHGLFELVETGRLRDALAMVRGLRTATIDEQLLGGELELGLMSSTTAGTMRSRIKILAVTSRNRDPSLPDVPSIHEAGVRNYDATFWFGLLAPAGTPSTVIDRLNQLMRATLNDPEVARSSRSQGLNPAPSTPQEFAALIKADYAKWKKVIGEK